MVVLGAVDLLALVRGLVRGVVRAHAAAVAAVDLACGRGARSITAAAPTPRNAARAAAFAASLTCKGEGDVRARVSTHGAGAEGRGEGESGMTCLAVIWRHDARRPSLPSLVATALRPLHQVLKKHVKVSRTRSRRCDSPNKTVIPACPPPPSLPAREGPTYVGDTPRPPQICREIRKYVGRYAAPPPNM